MNAFLVLGLCVVAVLVYDYIKTRMRKKAFVDRLRDPQIRDWRAHSPSGSVPLGRCSYDEALLRTSRLGKVSYVDEVNGLMFYDTHLGPISFNPEGPSNSGQS